MSKLYTLTLFAVCFLISACSVSTGCDDMHSYRYTQVQDPVKVPADLDEPVNESTAPETENTDPNTIDRNAAGECLEKPPKI